MSKIINVGLVQQAASASVADNIEKLGRSIISLARKGAELVILQELHNTPYFCQTENTAMFDLAETIPGPSTEYFSSLAAQLHVVIVSSLFEKRAAGLYHNTAVVFDSDGCSTESAQSLPSC